MSGHHCPSSSKQYWTAGPSANVHHVSVTVRPSSQSCQNEVPNAGQKSCAWVGNAYPATSATNSTPNSDTFGCDRARLMVFRIMVAIFWSIAYLLELNMPMRDGSRLFGDVGCTANR